MNADLLKKVLESYDMKLIDINNELTIQDNKSIEKYTYKTCLGKLELDDNDYTKRILKYDNNNINIKKEDFYYNKNVSSIYYHFETKYSELRLIKYVNNMKYNLVFGRDKVLCNEYLVMCNNDNENKKLFINMHLNDYYLDNDTKEIINNKRNEILNTLMEFKVMAPKLYKYLIDNYISFKQLEEYSNISFFNKIKRLKFFK